MKTSPEAQLAGRCAPRVCGDSCDDSHPHCHRDRSVWRQRRYRQPVCMAPAASCQPNGGAPLRQHRAAGFQHDARRRRMRQVNYAIPPAGAHPNAKTMARWMPVITRASPALLPSPQRFPVHSADAPNPPSALPLYRLRGPAVLTFLMHRAAFSVMASCAFPWAGSGVHIKHTNRRCCHGSKAGDQLLRRLLSLHRMPVHATIAGIAHHRLAYPVARRHVVGVEERAHQPDRGSAVVEELVGVVKVYPRLFGAPRNQSRQNRQSPAVQPAPRIEHAVCVHAHVGWQSGGNAVDKMAGSNRAPYRGVDLEHRECRRHCFHKGRAACNAREQLLDRRAILKSIGLVREIVFPELIREANQVGGRRRRGRGTKEEKEQVQGTHAQRGGGGASKAIRVRGAGGNSRDTYPVSGVQLGGRRAARDRDDVAARAPPDDLPSRAAVFV